MGSEVNGILVAAQELKTPFVTMRQLALAFRLAENSEQQGRIRSQIVNLSERSLLQIQDLVKVAKLEAGLFAMEPVSVRGVCEAVNRDMSGLFGYDRKSLKMHYRNRQRLVVANAELLYSVIYHFCSNALHYSDDKTSSTLTVSDNDGNIKIDVRDYGPALPMSVWRELQSDEMKVPQAVAMRPGSSGLGLYVSSRFAKYMHAQFGAVRHRDGTSFYVKLPVSKQATLFG